MYGKCKKKARADQATCAARHRPLPTDLNSRLQEPLAPQSFVVQIRTISLSAPWLRSCTPEGTDLAKIPTASIASPRRRTDDLKVLHAALDSRLAALDAALGDPNDFQLEGLILDLARA